MSKKNLINMQWIRRASLLILYSLSFAGVVYAQNDDPVVMMVAGQPVSRSEFEYSYNKNNSEGVIDKKTIEEYVDLFINYKLKVQAALDAHLDTAKSFLDEFAGYRNQQIRPLMITDEDVEVEARNIYQRTQHIVDSLGGLVRPSHILLQLKQRASQEEDDAVKARIDSIYNALKKGADFAELAKKFSQDPGSAVNGGDISWIQKGQTVKEFEEAAYALKVGEISKPVKSPFGYHIILLKDKRNFFPYDSLRTNIIRFIDARGIREHIIDRKLDEIVKQEGTTREEILEKKAEEASQESPEMKNLIKEYHDGLLLYEISNQYVWDKAAKDEAGLANYFKKNKKKYQWETPRFKGIAYHVKDAADVKAVKNSIKNVAFEKWADVLRKTFNNDSVLRIRVEKGIFKKGDNALVDKMKFGKDTTVVSLKDYPIDAVYGKILKKGPECYEDVKGLVIADYQEQLEKEWVADLRKKYPVTVFQEVVATVNKHDQ